MLVYRLSPKEEIDKILKNKSLKNAGTLGKVYIKEEGEINLNNHHYEENEYYMHFFPKLRDILYINPEKDMYLCFYDIPEEILNKNLGFGQYKDIFALTTYIKTPEYCIKTKDLDFDYLEEINLITDNTYMEDFFFFFTLSKFQKNIYKKEKQKTI